MCKVSCYINQNKIILTSSRDIPSTRIHSLPPKTLYINNKVIVAPIDPKGKGTWIGLEKNKIICLLNHSGKDEPSHSRGKLVLKLLSEEIKINDLHKKVICFNSFKLIYLDIKLKNHKEYLWDGKELQINNINSELNIWLSNTIYNNKESEVITKSFKEIHKNNVNKNNLLNFHENNILNKKSLTTTSITQIYHESHTDITYNDLINNKQFYSKLSL